MKMVLDESVLGMKSDTSSQSYLTKQMFLRVLSVFLESAQILTLVTFWLFLGPSLEQVRFYPL